MLRTTLSNTARPLYSQSLRVVATNRTAFANCGTHHTRLFSSSSPQQEALSKPSTSEQAGRGTEGAHISQWYLRYTSRTLRRREEPTCLQEMESRDTTRFRRQAELAPSLLIKSRVIGYSSIPYIPQRSSKPSRLEYTHECRAYLSTNLCLGLA